jgi:uncharacterized protein (TIGR02246 family)
MAAKPIPVPALDPEQSIRAVAKEFETHYNARDIEKLLALFANDGRILAPFREGVAGRGPVRTVLEEGFKKYEPRNTVIETTYVEYSGDIAFSLGTNTSNILMPDGSRIDDRGKWMTSMRRERGQWQLVALIYNTDLPLPGTPR